MIQERFSIDKISSIRETSFDSLALAITSADQPFKSDQSGFIGILYREADK